MEVAMPICFQLTRKDNREAGPVVLQRVDDDMRAHFGAEPDPDKWYERWYDTIGFECALGHDWAKCRELYPHKAAIIDWLEANYTTDAWREIGKR